LKSLCRYLLYIKSTHNLGDIAFSSIVGSIISFLPNNNKLANYVGENPSTYNVINAVEKLSNLKKCCRVLKFQSCDHGKCIIPLTGMSCNHPKIKNKSLYYLPIRDRIMSLLKSDIKNLLFYSDFIPKVDDNNVMLMQCQFYINKCSIYINQCHFYVKIMSKKCQKNVLSITFLDLLIF
jgi:hypothetical protein